MITKNLLVKLWSYQEQLMLVLERLRALKTVDDELHPPKMPEEMDDFFASTTVRSLNETIDALEETHRLAVYEHHLASRTYMETRPVWE